MSEDRNEKASLRRKQKAREEGDRPSSRELGQAAAMLAGAYALGPVIARSLSLWRTAVTSALNLRFGPTGPGGECVELSSSIRSILLTCLMPFAAVLIAAACGSLFAGLTQSGGVNFRPAALAPK